MLCMDWVRPVKTSKSATESVMGLLTSISGFDASGGLVSPSHPSTPTAAIRAPAKAAAPTNKGSLSRAAQMVHGLCVLVWIPTCR